MYIAARIPQIDDQTRFLGFRSRRDAREAAQTIRDDPAMVDYLRPDEIRDCERGRRPRGWMDL